MFTGSLVALITPFKNGSVDEKGFEKFVAKISTGLPAIHCARSIV